jgi:hypothetical protein
LAAGGNQPRVIRGCRVDAHPRLCALWPRRGRDRTPLRPQLGARLLDQMGPSCGCLDRWTGFCPRLAKHARQVARPLGRRHLVTDRRRVSAEAGPRGRPPWSEPRPRARPEAIRSGAATSSVARPRDPRASPACVVHGSSTTGRTTIRPSGQRSAPVLVYEAGLPVTSREGECAADSGVFIGVASLCVC